MTVEVAQLVKALLDALGLEAYPKTSGSDGIHVLVPIARRAAFEEARDFAEIVAGTLARTHPGPGHDAVGEGQAPRRADRREPEPPGSDDRVGLLGPPAPGRSGVDAALVGRAEAGARPERLHHGLWCSTGSPATAISSPRCSAVASRSPARSRRSGDAGEADRGRRSGCRRRGPPGRRRGGGAAARGPRRNRRLRRARRRHGGGRARRTKAGGTTIGILPGESPREANPWIEHAVATGIGHARNLAVAASGDALIAIGGSWGTASEIALARRLGRPVVVLGAGPEIAGEGIVRAATPEEAVAHALAAAST